MDFREFTKLSGIAEAGYSIDGSGFNIFQIGGSFKLLPDDIIKKMLQPPLGVILPLEGELYSFYYYYDVHKKHNYFIFSRLECLNQKDRNNRIVYAVGSSGYLYNGEHPMPQVIYTMLYATIENAKNRVWGKNYEDHSLKTDVSAISFHKHISKSKKTRFSLIENINVPKIINFISNCQQHYCIDFSSCFMTDSSDIANTIERTYFTDIDLNVNLSDPLPENNSDIFKEADTPKDSQENTNLGSDTSLTPVEVDTPKQEVEVLKKRIFKLEREIKSKEKKHLHYLFLAIASVLFSFILVVYSHQESGNKQYLSTIQSYEKENKDLKERIKKLSSTPSDTISPSNASSNYNTSVTYPKVYYRPSSGETIYDVSDKFGVTLQELKEWNSKDILTNNGDTIMKYGKIKLFIKSPRKQIVN